MTREAEHEGEEAPRPGGRGIKSRPVSLICVILIVVVVTQRKHFSRRRARERDRAPEANGERGSKNLCAAKFNCVFIDRLFMTFLVAADGF